MGISAFTNDQARTRFLTAYEAAFNRLWPSGYETTDVATSFGTTRVYRSGPPTGDPFVLLPGAGGNALSWYPHVARLSGSRPVLAIDPIGEPGSSTQDTAIEDGRDLARWLDEVLSAVEVDRAHLIGCSYGGWVALQHALLARGRAATLTLLDPAGFGRVTPRFLAWVIAGGLAGFAPAPVRRRLAGWLHNATLRDDDLMRLVRLVVAFRRRLPVPPTLSDDDLRRVDVPTLVLLGQRSQLYDARQVAERLRAVVPAARVEVVPGAGHDLPLYCPDLIADRATQFADAQRSSDVDGAGSSDK